MRLFFPVRILAVLLLLLSLYVQAGAALDGDKLLAMQVAHLWLSGKRLYVDLVQLNPPPIYVIYGMVARAAAALGVSDSVGLYLCVVGLCALSTGVLCRLVAYHPYYRKGWRVPHALFLAMLFIIWPNPAHFGDREHLFFLLTLPFIIQQMPSLRHVKIPRSFSVLIACMAAVGFAIKPYCLVVYGGVQLVVLLQERRLRLFFAGTQGLLLLFLALVWGGIALYSPEYFTQLLPLAMESYKHMNQGRIGSIYFAALALFYLLLPLTDFRPRRASPLRRDVWFLIAILPAYIGYIICNNGWEYTFYPFNSMVLYLTGWLALEHAFFAAHAENEGVRKQGRFGMRACQVAVAFHILQVLGLYIAAWNYVQEQTALGAKLHLQNDDFEAFMHAHHVHSFGAMSATFTPWPLLWAHTGAVQETRFSELWPLPQWVAGDEAYRQGHVYLVEYVAEALAEDMTRNQPDIIFVDASPEFHLTGKHVDIPQLLASHSPAFAQAWKGYRLALQSNYCGDKGKAGCHYDIYERVK